MFLIPGNQPGDPSPEKGGGFMRVLPLSLAPRPTTCLAPEEPVSRSSHPGWCCSPCRSPLVKPCSNFTSPPRQQPALAREAAHHHLPASTTRRQSARVTPQAGTSILQGVCFPPKKSDDAPCRPHKSSTTRCTRAQLAFLEARGGLLAGALHSCSPADSRDSRLLAL